MTKLFSSQSIIEVKILQALLEDNEIACTTKKENLGMARGELPFTETWPEVWVIDDASLPAAQAILDGWKSGAKSNEPSWVCAECRSEIEGQFTACWNCGAEKPA